MVRCGEIRWMGACCLGSLLLRQVFDQDGSGALDADELSAMLSAQVQPRVAFMSVGVSVGVSVCVSVGVVAISVATPAACNKC